ncbi:MAG: hypothetical protein KGI51_15365 [Rhodospirillales bacterium]|nr:hypothetical protein [Rhodospirillales bacterium]
MPPRAVPAAILLGLLAACAAPAPKPAPVAAAPAAPVWDGAYHGTSTRYRAAARDCPHPGILTLYVAQNQFYFPWRHGGDVLAAIGPHGTVRGAGPGIAVTGHAEGKRMSGNATDGMCGLHFTVRRRF